MPNGIDKKLNFVPKIYDTVAQAWKPFYIPPDATDKVQGDVKLSDSIDSDLNAATGMTAASPAAVKAVANVVNTKLDKIQSEAQEVTSEVTFKNIVNGASGFIGDLTGNSSSATILQTARKIGVKSGNQAASSANFNGSGDITITINSLDATTLQGMVPIASIPAGAMERVVSYATLEDAVDAYTSAEEGSKPFSEGDTIRVTSSDPNLMYAVIGDPSSQSNYVEYSAGSAMTAVEAEKLSVGTVGSTSVPVYFNNGIPETITTLGMSNGGTGATTVPNIANNLKYSSIGERSNIADNANLNTYTTSGSYKVSESANAKTIKNTPKESSENVAFILDVIANVGTGSTYLRQRLSYYNDFDVWERVYLASGQDSNYPELTNQWSKWHKISTAELSSANVGMIIYGEDIVQENPTGSGLSKTDGDSTSESSQIGVVSARSSVGAYQPNLAYNTFGNLLMGSYSVILRVKATSLTSPSILGVTIRNSDDTLIKNVNISTDMLQQANQWECLSFGVNLSGGKDASYKIAFQDLASAANTSMYIDYIRIIPSGTALGSIG